MDALLDTVPHRLIEASLDGLWGRGGDPKISKNMIREPLTNLTSLAIWPLVSGPKIEGTQTAKRVNILLYTYP